MKVRLTGILAALAIFAMATPGMAQMQTGDITGKVTDNTGAMLPGVIVTLSGANLIQAQTASTQRGRHLSSFRACPSAPTSAVRASRLQDRGA